MKKVRHLSLYRGFALLLSVVCFAQAPVRLADDTRRSEPADMLRRDHRSWQPVIDGVKRAFPIDGNSPPLGFARTFAKKDCLSADI
jgi:hypothetical protein